MENIFNLQLSKEEAKSSSGLSDLKFALYILGFAMEDLETELKKVSLDEESLRMQLDDVVPIY